MSKPIKILYVLHSASKYEGSNRSLLYLIEGMKEKNTVPFVVLPKGKDISIYDEFNRLGIQYSEVALHKEVYSRLKTFKDYLLFLPILVRHKIVNFFAVKEIILFAKSHDIDIIHSNIGPMLVGYKAAKKLRLPHVWHLREFYQDIDVNFKTYYSKSGFKEKLNDALNNPVPITESVANHFGVSRDNIIYNGVAYENDVSFNSEKENYFLFVGSLSNVKGIDFLLKNFARFVQSEKGYTLFVAGDTSDKEYKDFLHRLVADMGISKNVVFLGNTDEVPKLMIAARAFIMASLYEGFGRVTAEAMFNGCLVIGNNTGGTHEILKNGRLGLVYSSSDELLACMKEVAQNDPSIYRDTILSAQKTASELYSIEQCVKKVFDLYEKILKT